jgi:hypothetical protein
MKYPGLIMARVLALVALCVALVAPAIARPAAGPRVHLCTANGGASVDWRELTGEPEPAPAAAPVSCALCVGAATPFLAPPGLRLAAPRRTVGDTDFAVAPDTLPAHERGVEYAARAPPAA